MRLIFTKPALLLEKQEPDFFFWYSIGKYLQKRTIHYGRQDLLNPNCFFMPFFVVVVAMQMSKINLTESTTGYIL